MDLSVKTISGTAEASTSFRQATRLFDAALRPLAAKEPSFLSMQQLVVCLTLHHPVSEPWPAKRSFDTKQQAYYSTVPVEYPRFGSREWQQRTSAIADAVREAISRVAKTRLSQSERARLYTLVSEAEEAVVQAPPEQIEEIQSIFLIYDEASPEHSCISFTGVPLLPISGGRVVELLPEDAAMAVSLRRPQEPPPAFRLYRRLDGALHYHEALLDGEVVREHWGRCGEAGEQHAHPVENTKSAKRILQELKRKVRAQGYRPIAPSRHTRLLVEWAVEGMGSPEDLDRRHAAQLFLGDCTARLGLGHCDGGSIGSGSMEVCCFVVDFALAEEVLRRELAGTAFGNFTQIYQMK